MSASIAHHERNSQAFALPFAELAATEYRAFAFGNRSFNLRWAVAPASAPDVDGLGPTFVQPSCSSCHLRDGRSRLPEANTRIEQAVIKLSPRTERDRKWLERRYGDQLQNRSIPGVGAEADASVLWKHVLVDRHPLRYPTVTIERARFPGLEQRANTDVLVAPSVFGLGLLEAVPVQQISERDDPNDQDKDGVSGRMHWLDSRHETLGRFGWKASVSSLRNQTLAAAHGDMGLTHGSNPAENCPPRQRDCASAVRGSSPDLNERTVDAIVMYLQLLAVPAPRTDGADQIAHGRALFFRTGCETCHRESFQTSPSATPKLLASQTITAYTDLLLHDLGPKLGGHHQPGSATGNEWRTPPLWGLGLIPAVNGHQQLLHDGRAQNIREAILWHDGEAKSSRNRFEALSEPDQASLLAFLESL